MSWYWIAALAAIVLLALVSRRGEAPDSRRLQSGNAPTSPEHIDELLRAGQRIEAIKEYRAVHGVGLKEAKDAIDARARELGR